MKIYAQREGYIRYSRFYLNMDTTTTKHGSDNTHKALVSGAGLVGGNGSCISFGDVIVVGGGVVVVGGDTFVCGGAFVM